ncbi:ABC transporter permease subunit [Christensenellaceae bacterium OttesenSCG-928-M15]|nr:ABC transporter permease subunit [Christensenellaceae bacterium OttesenSCG-928-M15]
MKAKGFLRGAAVAAFWLLVWQCLSALVNKELILPSPVQTAARFISLMQEKTFWLSTLYSLCRVLGGYLAAVVLGILLGVATAASPFLNALLRPVRSIMKAMPVASFILLLLLWMNTAIAPAFTSFLMVLPLVWANVQEGYLQTDEQLLEMGKIFKLTKWKLILHIYWPGIFPYLLSACATGIGFAFKAGVAAEVIAKSSYSIGKYLIESKNYLETADMFAWTALVILLSILLERTFVHFLKKTQANERWRAASK